jgi:hypothetical protein
MTQKKGVVVKSLPLLGALVLGTAAALLAVVLIARDGPDASGAVARGNAAVLHVPGASMGATWMRPMGFSDMVAKTDHAVLATVTAVEAGPAEMSDEPGDPGTPTQRISFRVDERWRGPSIDSFVLYKTGTQSIWIDDDPPYHVGEQYVMFVRARAGDPRTLLNVGPDGRIKIVDGNLRPLIEGAVAARLGGLTVAQARQATQANGGQQ